MIITFILSPNRNNKIREDEIIELQSNNKNVTILMLGNKFCYDEQFFYCKLSQKRLSSLKMILSRFFYSGYLIRM